MTMPVSTSTTDWIRPEMAPPMDMLAREELVDYVTAELRSASKVVRDNRAPA